MSIATVPLRRVALGDSHPVAAAVRAGFTRDAGAWTLEHHGRHFTVLRGRENIARRNSPPDWRWHVSVAGAGGDVPPWDLLVAVGHQLRPGVVFVVGVPPRSWWINVHTGCLHLWEIRDAELEELWHGEARGDAPS